MRLFLMPLAVFAMGFGGVCRAADESVLLWFLNNPSIETWGGGTIHATDLPGWNADENLNTLGARVQVFGTGDDSPVYLNLWYYDEINDFYYKDLGIKEAWVNEYGDSGVNFGVIPAVGDPTELSFLIELGNLTADGTGWEETLAWSNLATYDELFQSGHISLGELSIPDHSPWSNLYFTQVPEPSSGLMLLFGSMLVLLKRPRVKADRRRQGKCIH